MRLLVMNELSSGPDDFFIWSNFLLLSFVYSGSLFFKKSGQRMYYRNCPRPHLQVLRDHSACLIVLAGIFPSYRVF
jgi:hypothetical protein